MGTVLGLVGVVGLMTAFAAGVARDRKKRGAVVSSGLRPERKEKPKEGPCRGPDWVFLESEGLEPRREQAARDKAKRRTPRAAA